MLLGPTAENLADRDDTSTSEVGFEFLLSKCRTIMLLDEEVTAGRRVSSRRRLPWPVAPGRVFRLPSVLFSEVRRDAGDVTIGLSQAAIVASLRLGPPRSRLPR